MEHKDFILSPITRIINEATLAVRMLDEGIQTNPLMNYLFHSIFMQLTGSQEQKLKCVCWEIATKDYDFRYNWLKGKGNYNIGECSCYDDKTRVYKMLLQHLENSQVSSISTIFDEEKIDLLQEAKQCVEELGKQHLFKPATTKLDEFISFASNIEKEDLITQNSLFSDKKVLDRTIKEIYEQKLYRQRNRSAHNTLSYQTNTPTFNQLIAKDACFENYFIYFYLLILIDGIIRILFNRWCKLL